MFPIFLKENEYTHQTWLYEICANFVFTARSSKEGKNNFPTAVLSTGHPQYYVVTAAIK